MDKTILNPKDLKILLLSVDFKPNPGGEAQLAYSIAQSLGKIGNDVTVLAPAGSKEGPEDKNINGSVIRQLELRKFVPLKRIQGWLLWPMAMVALRKSIWKVVREKSPDICLVTSYMSWVMLAIWGLKIPYTLFLHGEEVTWIFKRRGLFHGGFSRWLLQQACEKAEWVFFNSNYSRNILGRILPTLMKKSESVGVAIQTNVDWSTKRRDEARKALNWKEGPVLLGVGKLVMRKGVGVVIRAMPEILKQYPNCRYVVVGDGIDRLQLEAIVQETGMKDHVFFSGYVENEIKQKIYAASDIFIMVSYPGDRGEEEGFGIVFLEANLHGLPVIASRCGGIPESVEHQGSGLLVEPKRPDQVASAALRLLDDSRLCKQMAERGRERIKSHFNLEAIGALITKRLTKVAMKDRLQSL